MREFDSLDARVHVLYAEADGGSVYYRTSDVGQVGFGTPLQVPDWEGAPAPLPTAAPTSTPEPTPTVTLTPLPDLSDIEVPLAEGDSDLSLYLGGGLAVAIVVGVLVVWGLRRRGQ